MKATISPTADSRNSNNFTVVTTKSTPSVTLTLPPTSTLSSTKRAQSTTSSPTSTLSSTKRAQSTTSSSTSTLSTTPTPFFKTPQFIIGGSAALSFIFVSVIVLLIIRSVKKGKLSKKIKDRELHNNPASQDPNSHKFSGYLNAMVYANEDEIKKEDEMYHDSSVNYVNPGEGNEEEFSSITDSTKTLQCTQDSKQNKSQDNNYQHERSYDVPESVHFDNVNKITSPTSEAKDQRLALLQEVHQSNNTRSSQKSLQSDLETQNCDVDNNQIPGTTHSPLYDAPGQLDIRDSPVREYMHIEENHYQNTYPNDSFIPVGHVEGGYECMGSYVQNGHEMGNSDPVYDNHDGVTNADDTSYYQPIDEDNSAKINAVSPGHKTIDNGLIEEWGYVPMSSIGNQNNEVYEVNDFDPYDDYVISADHGNCAHYPDGNYDYTYVRKPFKNQRNKCDDKSKDDTYDNVKGNSEEGEEEDDDYEEYDGYVIKPEDNETDYEPHSPLKQEDYYTIKSNTQNDKYQEDEVYEDINVISPEPVEERNIFSQDIYVNMNGMSSGP